MIALEGLTVFYGRGSERRVAVDGVSFSIAAGEAFGLVGESGSGKSTLLKAVAGLLDDWSGAIRVAGEAQGRRRSRTFRRTVQMVFQDPYGSLHPRHTVDRILGEPLRIHGIGGCEERVLEALAAVGLDGRYRYRYPHQLSGGQRQRIAIARALVLEPRLLLLDEPTSALDVSVQAEILNLLKRLQKERGLTYLFVSHDLGVIAHLCCRLAVMQQGRVVEQLSREALARGEALHPYTRELRAALGGYRAAPAPA